MSKKIEQRFHPIYYIGVIFLIGVFALLAIILSSKVEISGDLKCNSGNVDLKYEQTYQERNVYDFFANNYSRDFYFQSIPKYLIFNGIDNLNCEGSFNVKGNPIMLGLVSGATNE